VSLSSGLFITAILVGKCLTESIFSKISYTFDQLLLSNESKVAEFSMLPDWYEAGCCNYSLMVVLAHELFISQLATHRTLKENDIIEISHT
jgi:hypothetical protein